MGRLIKNYTFIIFLIFFVFGFYIAHIEYSVSITGFLIGYVILLGLLWWIFENKFEISLGKLIGAWLLCFGVYLRVFHNPTLAIVLATSIVVLLKALKGLVK